MMRQIAKQVHQPQLYPVHVLPAKEIEQNLANWLIDLHPRTEQNFAIWLIDLHPRTLGWCVKERPQETKLNITLHYVLSTDF